MLSKLGSQPTVVLSDDDQASQKILNFSSNDSEWIVAVRMVSEGVDIPRLCVGLFATSTTTELFFRQAVGRIVRSSGKSQEAMMFIPNDPRLVSHANNMAQSRVHSMKVIEPEEQADHINLVEDQNYSDSNLGDAPDQMSMFEVLSSTPIYREDEVFKSTNSYEYSESVSSKENIQTSIDIELAPLPNKGQLSVPTSYEEIVELKKERSQLRQANTDLVHVLAGLTKESHAKVNARLNKMAGINSIIKANNSELENRKKAASNWVVSLRRKRAI